MAKKKLVLGSVLKTKEAGKPDYIKLDAYHANVLAKALASLPAGGSLMLNLESKAAQLKNLEEGVSSGRLKAESADKMRPFIEKIPDFVRFQVTMLVDKE